MKLISGIIPPALLALLLLQPIAIFGEKESLETLLAYLKSPVASTRREAARKLGERRVRNQHAVEALSVSVRKDESPEVRAEGLKSLGLIKDFAAAPEMTAALHDPEPMVRRAAVKSLVALYTEHDIDFITSRRTGWNRLNPFLDTADGEIIEPYITVDVGIINGLGEAARGDHDRDVRIAAIRGLGVLRGRAAIPYLADALTADSEVRIDVIRTFIKIGDPAAGEYLISFFRDSDRRVRTQAMYAAGALKFRPATSALISVYRLGPEKTGTVTKVSQRMKGPFSYMPGRDEAALWALALIGDPEAESIFVSNMTNKDADCRQYAFEGLARIGNPNHKEEILRMVATEHSGDVKLAQYWALYRIGNRSDIQYVANHLDGDHQEQARQYLLETTDPTGLYPYLRSGNKTVRIQTIELLGRIGDRETVRELEPTVHNSGAETANAATLAIKRIEWRMEGKPRAEDSVFRRVSDETSRPRKAGTAEREH